MKVNKVKVKGQGNVLPQRVLMAVGNAKFDSALPAKIRASLMANKRKFVMQN
jgi:hypothetical protein